MLSVHSHSAKGYALMCSLKVRERGCLAYVVWGVGRARHREQLKRKGGEVLPRADGGGRRRARRQRPLEHIRDMRWGGEGKQGYGML